MRCWKARPLADTVVISTRGRVGWMVAGTSGKGKKMKAGGTCGRYLCKENRLRLFSMQFRSDSKCSQEFLEKT